MLMSRRTERRSGQRAATEDETAASAAPRESERSAHRRRRIGEAAAGVSAFSSDDGKELPLFSLEYGGQNQLILRWSGRLFFRQNVNQRIGELHF